MSIAYEPHDQLKRLALKDALTSVNGTSLKATSRALSRASGQDSLLSNVIEVLLNCEGARQTVCPRRLVGRLLE